MPSAARQLLRSGGFGRLGNEMAWVIVGQGMAAVGGMVGVRVLTEVLTPDRYGELALGITLATLGQLVAWSPISAAVLRYFSPAQESSRLDVYFHAVRRLLVHATLGFIGLGSVIVVALVALGAGRWIGLALAALLFTLLSGYESALDSMQLAGRQRRIVALHQGAATWLRFLLAAALISLSTASSTTAMTGFVVGVLLVLVSQLFFFRRRVLPMQEESSRPSADDHAALARRMTEYAWPVGAWGIFSWVQAVSDRWILQGFTSTATVGVYSAVNQVGFYPMALFSAVTLQFVSPVLFARAGDGTNSRRLHDASGLVLSMVIGTLAVTAIATIISALAHEAVFSVLVAARYRSVSGLLPWMVCAGGLFAAGQAASQVMLLAGSTKRLLVPKAAIALVTLALYTLGARLRALDGIVYANTAFGMLYFITMAVIGWRWRTATLRHLPDPVVVEPVR